MPFVIEDQVVGKSLFISFHSFLRKERSFKMDSMLLILCRFVDHLKEFPGVFTCLLGNGDHRFDDGHVTLHESLSTPGERTRAVAGVIKCLRELIPGISSEVFVVTSLYVFVVFNTK